MKEKSRSLFINIDLVSSMILQKLFGNVPRINCLMYYIGGAFTFPHFVLKTGIFLTYPTYLPDLSKCASSFQPHTEQTLRLLLQPSYRDLNI